MSASFPVQMGEHVLTSGKLVVCSLITPAINVSLPPEPTIAAVLWHQGESDCSEDRYPFYEEKCTVIMNALRQKLGLYDVPFLLGGLGDYLEFCERSEKYKNYPYVNEALKRIAEKDKMMGYVSAEGLGANPDNLHFSAEALREFGVRYYHEFVKLEDKNKVFIEKSTPDQAIRNDIEHL